VAEGHLVGSRQNSSLTGRENFIMLTTNTTPQCMPSAKNPLQHDLGCSHVRSCDLFIPLRAPLWYHLKPASWLIQSAWISGLKCYYPFLKITLSLPMAGDWGRQMEGHEERKQ
jgi:hypothetical protein